MAEMTGRDGGMTRRGVLHRGAKLAYVAPVVLATMKVESTFAASGGSTSNSNNNNNNSNNNNGNPNPGNGNPNPGGGR